MRNKFATRSTGGTGGGSVNSFSAGNAAPLFTTSVANPTTNPVLSFNITSQAANRVLAGPTSGGNAAPTFRALVAADIPNLSGQYIPLAGSNQIFGALFSPASLQDPFLIGRNNVNCLSFGYGDASTVSLTAKYGNQGDFNDYASISMISEPGIESSVSIVATSDTSTRSIQFNQGSSFTFSGADARYAADYSGSYTARSLVDKAYVDNIATGLTWKNAVKAATTVNISLSGAQTIDGVSIVAGDRVLVKNQTTATENGIYVASNSTWTRASDADTGTELWGCALYVQSGGTTNGGLQFANSNSSAITIGVTNITFAQISGAGTYTAGTGLTLLGNVFSIDSTVATLAGVQTLTNKTIAAASNTISGITNSNLSGSAGITNANLANSAISIAGNSTALGSSVTQDQITGLGSNGLIKRTGTNTLAIATAGTDYLAPLASQSQNLFYASPVLGDGNFSPRNFDNFDLPNANKLRLQIVDADAFGDSITVGVGASPTTESYINKLAVANAITINNYAVSSRGSYQAALNCITNKPATNNILSTIGMFGLNDICRATSVSPTPAAKTQSKIECAIRTVFANTNLNSAVAASATTNTGSWSNWTVLSTKSSLKLSGNARQSSSIGNTLSYTTTTASSTVVIGTIGDDGVNFDYGRFTVTIDGVLAYTYDPDSKTDGISDGNNNNQLMYDTIIINNLRNSTHTIIITVLDNKTTVIDYIGNLIEPNYAKSFFYFGVPKLTSAGYATYAGNANDSIVEALNVNLKSLLYTYCNNFPSVFIDPNRNGYDPTTDTNDGIHPNNSGYTKIAKSGQESILSTRYIFGKTIVITDGVTTGFNAYQGYTSARLLWGVNRNPVTGIFDNLGYTGPMQEIYATINDSGMKWWTTTSANTTPTQRMDINGNGRLSVYGSYTGINIRTAVGTEGGITIYGSNEIGFGANVVGGNWTARATSANMINAASGDINFYGNNSLTIGNSFTQQIRFKFDINSNFIIQTGTAATAPASLTRGIVVPSGVAPSASFTDGFILYSSDRGGTAGKAGMTIRSEDGTSHIFSDRVGLLGVSPTRDVGIFGNLALENAGNGLYIKEGTNATMGVATLIAGTVTVNTNKVTTISRIFLSIQSLGTVLVPKEIGVTSRSAGTSFTITSSDVTDTSTVAWVIIEPN